MATLVRAALLVSLFCHPATVAASHSVRDLILTCHGDRTMWFSGHPEGHSRECCPLRIFPGEDITCDVVAIVEDSSSAETLSSPDPAAAGLQLLLVPSDKVAGEPNSGTISPHCLARLTDPAYLIGQRKLDAAPQPQDPGNRVSATFVLRYSALPQGHARIRVLVPREAMGPAVGTGVAGYVSLEEMLLVAPPRSVAEEDWAQFRHAMREKSEGRPAEAERIARTLLISHPLHSYLIALLAGVVDQQQRPSEAAALYREAARRARADLDSARSTSRIVSTSGEDEVKSWEERAAQLEARAAPR